MIKETTAIAAAKDARAKELVDILDKEGWTNLQFWESHQLLHSTPDRLMTQPLIVLLARWFTIEGDRIACGEHEPTTPEMEAWLMERWPVQSTRS